MLLGPDRGSRAPGGMTFRRRLLVTVSALSLAGAFAVAVLAGSSGPSIAGLVALLTLPPALVAVAFVLLVIACFSDQGEDGSDDGGIGKAGVDLPEPPTGGITFDWETFEAELRAYAERPVRAP